MFEIQSLERRQMLASNPSPEAAGPLATATLRADGTLEVFGTPGRDTLVVNQDHRSPRIRVRATINFRRADDREIGNFRAGDVKRIVVKGGNKDDRITVGVTGGMAKTIEGGKGNDQLAATGGNLRMLGGAGDDDLAASSIRQPMPDGISVIDDPGFPRHLWIKATANRFEGGDGRDTLSSIGGDDTVIGGAGEDLLNTAGNVTVRFEDLLREVIGEEKVSRDSRVAVFGVETIKTTVTNEFVHVIN